MLFVIYNEIDNIKNIVYIIFPYFFGSDNDTPIIKNNQTNVNRLGTSFKVA